MIRKFLLRPLWYTCIDFYLTHYKVRCLKYRAWHESLWFNYAICCVWDMASVFLCIFIQLGEYFHDYDWQVQQAAYGAAYLERWAADQYFKGEHVDWKGEGF